MGWRHKKRFINLLSKINRWFLYIEKYCIYKSDGKLCEFSISCPNCHKNPPLILSIQSSLLLNKSNIKSKCSCSKYEILSQDLKDFYIECTLDKKESPSTLKWEQSLSKGQIVSKDAIIESIQNEQNYLNIIYEKLIKKIEAFEDVITKIKNQVNKLFKWDEGEKYCIYKSDGKLC